MEFKIFVLKICYLKFFFSKNYCNFKNKLSSIEKRQAEINQRNENLKAKITEKDDQINNLKTEIMNKRNNLAALIKAQNELKEMQRVENLYKKLKKLIIINPSSLNNFIFLLNFLETERNGI
jgi:chromosome segregation ATPase